VDQEDQPFITVTIWYQLGSNTPTLMAQQTLTDGWNGANRNVSLRPGLPFQFLGTDERLWIVVNDEMRPTVAVVNIPRDIAFQRDLHDRMVALNASVITHKIVPPPPVPPRPFSQFDTTKLSAETDRVHTFMRDYSKARLAAGHAKSLRESVSQAMKVMRAYAELNQLSISEERWLYHLARVRDELAVTNDSTLFDLDSVFTRSLQLGGLKLSDRQLNNRSAFQKWLDLATAGEPFKFQLSPNEKKQLKSQRQMSETLIKQHTETLRELERIKKQMFLSLEDVQRDPGEKQAREDAEKTVNELSRVLDVIAADTNLLSRMQKHQALFKRLAD
jgi:hypothetical protein